MNKDLVLYEAPSGIQIAPNITDVSNMLGYNRALSERETTKINTAVQNQLYDMAGEYIWSRTINILKKDILQFGNEFVCEMLDRPNGDLDTISEYEIITLSADLGFINKTAKMEFLQFSETIQHYMSSEEPEEEYPSTKLVDMVRSCVKHVLGYDTVHYDVSFVEFRDKLKTESINQEHEIYTQLIDSPYFYKKTIVKTLLNLAKTLNDSAERENVLANIVYIVSGVWNNLSSDDKWSIGRSYAQANNNGDNNLSKAIKSLLIKVKGFDYVPENLRSNSYIKIAKDLLAVHFGVNNFYNEPTIAKLLCDMGSSIPVPALGACMTAILACKLGNTYGHSWDAQDYLDELLMKTSPDRWQYYLDTVLPTDQVILYKLTNDKTLERFKSLVNAYGLHNLPLKNNDVRKGVQYINTKSMMSAKKVFSDIYNKINE